MPCHTISDLARVIYAADARGCFLPATILALRLAARESQGLEWRMLKHKGQQTLLRKFATLYHRTGGKAYARPVMHPALSVKDAQHARSILRVMKALVNNNLQSNHLAVLVWAGMAGRTTRKDLMGMPWSRTKRRVADAINALSRLGLVEHTELSQESDTVEITPKGRTVLLGLWGEAAPAKEVACA